VIHQHVSVVQCGAGAWLKELASGYERRPTGSGSALEVCYITAYITRLGMLWLHVMRYTNPHLFYFTSLLQF